MLSSCSLRHHVAKIFHQARNVSILSSLESNSVLVSANKDVYTNLALEHWLYNNLRFSEANKQIETPVRRHPVVLIWTDESCIVIGRHQNPWIESNLGIINNLGLKIARRHSGGGCVYHDENNINISIIGDRKVFDNRQGNLEFLAQVLKEKYSIYCEPTKRNDLVHIESGSKVSGSAAKLGRFNSYHHFTLLIDTDKDSLHAAIRQNSLDFIKTNSSQSVRSKVINLKEIKPELEVNQVITELSTAYNKLYPPTIQPSRLVSEKGSTQEGDRQELKTLTQYRDQLCSWDWLYGMTPKFTLEKSYKFVENGKEKQVNICLEVNKGLFESIEIEGHDLLAEKREKFAYMIGTKFTYREAMINLTKLLKVDDESDTVGSNALLGSETLLTTFMLHMIRESNF